MIKKVLFMFSLFVFSVHLFAASFSELVDCALQNNSDIQAAQSDYDSALLSSKTLNGSFAPGVSVSSSASLTNDYDWDTTPDYSSSYITYSQPLPGGTTLSATGTYTATFAKIGEDDFCTQTPNVSFTLSQSLRPFWTQGTIHDPTILTAKQQAQYYNLQLQYTKKSVLQNLIQNYAYALIYKNEIQIYKNSISLVEEQLAALKELKTSGSTNQAKITELESSKWSYEEDLMSVQASYFSYLQNLKTLCGCEIEELEDVEETEVSAGSSQFVGKLAEVSTGSTNSEGGGDFFTADPMEAIYELKIQMLKTNRILEKQNSAPTLNFTLQPAWNLESAKTSDWKDSWENAEDPGWSGTVSVNLSPLLSAAASQKKKQYKISYEQAEKSYENYLQQKQYVQEQYQTLVQNYSQQLQNVSKLYEEGKTELADYKKQYDAGAISRLDYDSAKIRVENSGFSKTCVEIYLWMYGVLLKYTE